MFRNQLFQKAVFLMFPTTVSRQPYMGTLLGEVDAEHGAVHLLYMGGSGDIVGILVNLNVA